MHVSPVIINEHQLHVLPVKIKTSHFAYGYIYVNDQEIPIYRAYARKRNLKPLNPFLGVTPSKVFGREVAKTLPKIKNPSDLVQLLRAETYDEVIHLFRWSFDRFGTVPSRLFDVVVNHVD